jgi:trans-2,3-dihydro-3-hydroxyanthranilate isomerase
MMDIEYRVVDVFTQTPLEGNPLAVFPDASKLPEELLQKIARELNLSETAFVLAPTRQDCAARVRIFTPAYEMRFAGHPTIGTAYVLLETGLVPRDARSFALEEIVGPVNVRVDGDRDPLLWLQTPPIKKEGAQDPALCAAALHLEKADLLADIPCRIYSAGNPNLYVAVRDSAAVDRAAVEMSALAELRSSDGPVCMYVFAPLEHGAYSRMFAPELGVVEDPATGSAAGPLAAFMMDNGLRAGRSGERFTIEQGTKMGRRSILHVLVHGENGSEGIEIGGHVAPLTRATMTLAQ